MITRGQSGRQHHRRAADSVDAGNGIHLLIFTQHEPDSYDGHSGHRGTTRFYIRKRQLYPASTSNLPIKPRPILPAKCNAFIVLTFVCFYREGWGEAFPLNLALTRKDIAFIFRTADALALLITPVTYLCTLGDSLRCRLPAARTYLGITQLLAFYLPAVPALHPRYCAGNVRHGFIIQRWSGW